MRSYTEGLVHYEHVEIVSTHEISEFNSQLRAKLNAGWRVVQDVEVTRLPSGKMWGVVYTCVIAKMKLTTDTDRQRHGAM